MEENEKTNLEEIIEKDILENESSTTELEESQISGNVEVQTTDTGEAGEVQIMDTEEPNESQTNYTEEPIEAKYVEAESDETFDQPCQPCLSEAKKVESRKYCVNCKEYLCEICVQFHQKLSITKKHQLLHKADVKSKDNQKIVKPLETCPHHVGKELELFCEDHNKLCCSSCKATDHRKCVNVILIGDAATGVRDGEEFEDARKLLEALQGELNDIISKREDNAAQVIKERDDAIKVLTKSKADIIEQIDKLEKLDKKKINSKLAECSGVIQKDIENCKEVGSMMNNVSEILDNDRYDERYIFTQLKKAQQNIESAKQLIDAVSQNVGSEKIVYAEDKLLRTTLEDFKGLGILEHENRVYKKLSLKNVYIVKRLERKTNVNAICIIQDGWIVITDWSNEKLKLVDMSSYDVKNCIEFDQAPFDICKVSDSRVAVTVMYAKCVELVSVNIPRMKKEAKTNETGETCKGIAYLESQLFVACGGFLKEGPGHIKVFSLDGELKRSIIIDQSGTLIVGSPWKLEVSPVSGQLHIVDCELGLLKIRPNYPLQSELIRKSNSKGGICFDEYGHIFLADLERNVVEQIGRNGKLIGTVLTENDGIKEPSAMAYNTKTRQLLVGMKGSSNLCVFQLHYD